MSNQKRTITYEVSEKKNYGLEPTMEVEPGICPCKQCPCTDMEDCDTNGCMCCSSACS